MSLTAAGAHAQSRRGGQNYDDRITVRPGMRTVTREVHIDGGFSEINSRGNADVEYRQSGGRTRVEIVGSESLIEYVRVGNVMGVLEIGWTRNISIRGNAGIKVVVSAPDIDRITTNGTGDIRIMGPFRSQRLELATHGTGDIRFDGIKCNNLTLLARGSGDIDGGSVEAGMLNISVSGIGDVEIPQISAQTIEVAVSGTGDVEIGGRAGNATYKLRGTGDIDAYRLRAMSVNATVSGTGDIRCYAEQSFRASASGTGTIVFGGNPRNIDIRGNRRAVRPR